MTVTPPAPAPKKVSLKTVAEEVLFALVSFEAVLPTVAATATSLHLPQADVQVITAIGVGVAGVVSVLRQLLAPPLASLLRRSAK